MILESFLRVVVKTLLLSMLDESNTRLGDLLDVIAWSIHDRINKIRGKIKQRAKGRGEVLMQKVTQSTILIYQQGDI